MKIKQSLIAVFCAATSIMFGQAILPTSYNFDNFASAANLPTGWSTNISGTFTYSGGANSSALAGKLDLTGEYVQVQTLDPMGLTTFYLKGTGSAPWQGTFKVQESTNGSTFTDIVSYGNTSSTNVSTTGYTMYTVTPNSASRYLKFILSTKVSGYNMGLDEISIAAGAITAQEINVKQGTTTILSGGTSNAFNSPVSTALPITFTVENIGTVNTLNLTSATITGPAASDYAITAPSFPTTVAAVSNVPLNITFTPSAAGTRSAVLTINNDDSNEGTYVINLDGIGGNLATEPANAATNLLFSNIKSYRLNFSFTAAAGSPDGYLVLRKTSATPITDVPVDGVVYGPGDPINGSKVVFSGPATGATLNNVIANTTFQLAIYSYNGTGAFRNYNPTPLAGSVTSLGSMMPVAEYNGISTNAATFLTDLSAHINPHTFTYYSNYDETMVKLFSARDTTNGQKVLTCVYSGEQYIYSEPFAWGYMSREHSYCHNWMPTNPADGSGAAPNNVERPEYNDQHHLFPTNQNDVNAVRSNYPYGEVVTLQGTYLGFKFGADANGHYVVEPRDEHKGDAARALFYMATCYNGKTDAFGVVQNWKFRNPISATIQYGQDQNLLKKWHYQDPPDGYEIARNDFLDSLQGNRNPFIDSMQFACYIDFSNMTKIVSPTVPCNTGTIGINEKYNVEFDYSLFPNPSNGTFSLLLNTPTADVFTVKVIDVTGRVIESQVINGKQGYNYVSFEKNTLPAGAYMIETTTSKDKLVKKLIVQ